MAWARPIPVQLRKCSRLIQMPRLVLARRFWLWTLCALAACAPLIPATAPPQIKNTPGAFVVVTDKTFDAGLFRLDFPRSWSVIITSQAYYGHIQVVFKAPDGGIVSLRQVESAGSTADEYRILPNGVILRVAIEAAEQPSEQFPAQARQLLSSIRS